MSKGIKMSRGMAEAYIAALPFAFPEATVVPCGSYRRQSPSVGDLDVAVIGPQDFQVQAQRFAEIVDGTVIRGGQKIAVINTQCGHQIDLYNTSQRHSGAMELFLTGSARTNIKLRAKAKYKGFSLSQYGLFTREDRKLVASATEHEIFAALGLSFVPPEKR